MAQHRVIYTPTTHPPGRIKTHCHICGPLGIFSTEEEADHHARKHIS